MPATDRTPAQSFAFAAEVALGGSARRCERGWQDCPPRPQPGVVLRTRRSSRAGGFTDPSDCAVCSDPGRIPRKVDAMLTLLPKKASSPCGPCRLVGAL